jgi:D-galactarolactone isomerase
MSSEPIPHSEGTRPPRLTTPAGACDCHMHIYDERFPPARPGSRHQANARVEQYRKLQARLGTTRNVVVTPASAVTDNRVTLDAIAQLGANARGIAVVHPEISDAELKALAASGVRGIRFSVFDPRTAATSIDMIEPLAHRVADLGWHVQVHMRGDQIVDCAALFDRLPATLVFDHMGRLPQPTGAAHPAFSVICRLMDRGRAWVKLSGAYMDTRVGAPTYADASAVARAYIAVAPERVVWGSDWPHPTETEKPDDAILFDLLAGWALEQAIRRQILVDNAAALYGFPASPD